MATGTLDVNLLGDTAAALDLSTITTHAPAVTMHVVALTGAHTKAMIGIEVSPDGGTTWLPTQYVIRCCGEVTIPQCTSTDVRAITKAVEGVASTVTVFILAK